jgi:serine protease Do
LLTLQFAPAATTTLSQTDLTRPLPAPATAPKPAAARRSDLPAAFTKSSPATVADLKAMQRHITDLVRRVSPAVVDVEIGNGSGSGVIISADGLVLTAGHVCGAPNREARFTFPDGKTARGKTLGVDRDSDAGLIRITDPGNWPHVPVGEVDQAQLGDWVLALGNPGGFDAKRSLVVRLGRIIQVAPGALQTDCTISPGDSGGPLFDMYGRVIGIHSYISTSLAENFHVPITKFYEGWDQLAKSGQPVPPRAHLGALSEDTKQGCRLRAIDIGGPASKAGLRIGDVVLKVEDRDIKVAASFERWIAEADPGEVLKLEIKRGDQLLDLKVKLDAPPRQH